MTLLTIWLLGALLNALLIGIHCRGEEVDGREALILITLCALWIFGLPLVLWMMIWEGLNVSSKLTKFLEKKVVFKIPGGRS